MKDVQELIRGEMSAIRSIDAILNKLKNNTEKQELSTIRADHEKAVNALKRFAPGDLKDQEVKSGPWSGFASAFTGGASFFGDKAALNALKVGEQHGLNEYKEFLESNEVQSDIRQVITNELLPQQQRHLEVINRYLS